MPLSRPSFTTENRRRRLWARHHLGRPVGSSRTALSKDAPGAGTANTGEPGSAPWDPAEGVATVARDLVALHATDPASVYLGLRARVAGLDVEHVDRALYEDRTIARILAMRRTMFVAPRDRIPTLHAAAAWQLASVERRRNLRLLGMGGVDDPDAWHERVAARTMVALRELGEATATELTEAVPELGLQIEVNQGKKWAGTIGMSSRMLLWLAIVGQVSRARPRGTWKSTLYRWAPTREWLDLELEPRPDGPDAARAELARRYLRAFGPATFEDLHWWSGWNKTQTRTALEAIEFVEIDLANGPGLVLAGDAQAPPAAEDGPPDLGGASGDTRRVVLLPPLDTTTMGWKEREWYVGGHEAALFDRNGNAGPTVWLDGRMVGGWAQRESGEVVVRLLEDVGSEATEAAEAEAAALAEWLGDTRIRPRFRTSLEKDLSA